MEIFKGLQPELVWSYFEEICKIPRPSKKEEKIQAVKQKPRSIRFLRQR